MFIRIENVCLPRLYLLHPWVILELCDWSKWQSNEYHKTALGKNFYPLFLFFSLSFASSPSSALNLFCLKLLVLFIFNRWCVLSNDPEPIDKAFFIPSLFFLSPTSSRLSFFPYSILRSPGLNVLPAGRNIFCSRSLIIILWTQLFSLC